MFFQTEDGIRDARESRGLGDVYKRQVLNRVAMPSLNIPIAITSAARAEECGTSPKGDATPSAFALPAPADSQAAHAAPTFSSQAPHSTKPIGRTTPMRHEDARPTSAPVVTNPRVAMHSGIATASASAEAQHGIDMPLEAGRRRWQRAGASAISSSSISINESSSSGTKGAVAREAMPSASVPLTTTSQENMNLLTMIVELKGQLRNAAAIAAQHHDQHDQMTLLNSQLKHDLISTNKKNDELQRNCRLYTSDAADAEDTVSLGSNTQHTKNETRST